MGKNLFIIAQIIGGIAFLLSLIAYHREKKEKILGNMIISNIYIYIVPVWNGDEVTIRKTAFGCYFLWLIYNIFVFSIAGIISNVISIISTFIAIKNNNIKYKEWRSIRSI